MLSETNLLWLLLPVAAGLSWYLARRGSKRLSGAHVHRLRATYFRGLNYLLNEQADKAIETFLQIARLDEDAVEMQLALGNLFRRRGEVDRAIRVHQNLMSRSDLSAEQRSQALLELGEDYMRAGLLDRAESLFIDLASLNPNSVPALRHLISIYQQERDWHKAIEYAERLSRIADPQGDLIAQYYCELAEQARAKAQLDKARQYLDLAFASEPNCVRGLILQGHMAFEEGRCAGAIEAFEQVVGLDGDFAPQVLAPLMACYERERQMARAEAFLRALVESYPGVSPTLMLARLIEKNAGAEAARDFLSRHLRQNPTIKGLMALVESHLESGARAERDDLRAIGDIVGKLLASKPVYRCNRCGFGAKGHHWQCPSCKSWHAVKPIHGIAGN